MDLIDWDALYADYATAWDFVRAGTKPPARGELPPAAVARLSQPTSEDAAWLAAALRDEADPPDGRKWFVAQLLSRSDVLSEVLFVPVLDAGIDEVNPSSNREFIEPCIKAFGLLRVNEYLLSVLQSGTDFRKAGAVNAMYWAHALPTGPPFDTQATPESRAFYQSLKDIWRRQACVMLQTFVENSNVNVRRSIIPSLGLDPEAYPESLRMLVPDAIDIARRHEDEYIRHRVEVQLGHGGPLAPLPHRAKGAADAS